ncbi:copper resistance system multicopper oxidase [Acinetobacter marinus]|uniref:copper resistance system multicopper oxidase n=1 Tax=Acinetobacter marinus TaxID=281375 RepID=UPI000B859D08|nr:copper resistance system multicopper oxidase [Acinetobacter marinus]
MSIQTYSKYVLCSVLLASSTWSTAAVREYHLNIDENTVNVTGKPLKRITVNGQFPAPLLEFEEGDEAVIYVHNQLKDQDTSIHWHGLLLPGIMDGVPGFNQFHGIKPKGHFEYRFKIRQNGTYWYHAHSRGQEQDGLYGAFVVYPKGKMPVAQHEQADRDYVVMLSDFHDSTSAEIMKNLKKSAEYYQNQRETLPDLWQQIQDKGVSATWQDRKMWNQMRMLKTDLSDVTGYTFLVNGKTPEQDWTGAFLPNEKVRLRFVNASAMSFYDVRIPNLKMTVVSADGQPVQPVAVDEFRIGTAETYDVIVEPKQAHYQIQAESIDRTGFALASLTQQGTTAPKVTIPESRPRALLTMADMGHGAHQADSASHSQMDHTQMNHAKMNHEMMSHQNMQQMNHSEMDHSMHMNQAMDHSQMNHQTMNHESMNHGQMNHEQMNHSEATKQNEQNAEGWADASTPAGHKALQYQDLKSLTPQTDTRVPKREIEIKLGGIMERYIWTINGKKFTEAEPLTVNYGERIRLKFVNESMMAHPMHLHGMFMQLENGQAPQDLPNKHTVIVPPNKTVSLLLTADELGEWAIHCHLLYHMSAGMMNKLIVAQVDEDQVNAQSKMQDKVQNYAKGEDHAHH